VIDNHHRIIAARALQKASLKDPLQRKSDPMVIEAWAEHLAGHNLTDLDDALQAVYEHYDAPAPKVMYPGDLVTRMRAIRSDRAMRENDEQRQARIARNDAKLADAIGAAADINHEAAEQRRLAIAGFAGPNARVPAAS
jgi:hypothetical protein